MKKLAIAAIVAIALAGCATSSGPQYQRASSQTDNGYSEIRLDENRYEVSYRTEYGDPLLAQDWALRRAAELTRENDYDWFQVLSRSRGFSDKAFERYDRARMYDRDDDRYRDLPRYDPRYDNDAVAVISVLMGNNPPPRAASVYDARSVLDEMRSRY